ncbi:MAG: hypothetical protein KKH28_08945 [Elusimicrobia bacterium]|nr:hypothetical protein [Elusimicrobiota bacterium]
MSLKSVLGLSFIGLAVSWAVAGPVGDFFDRRIPTHGNYCGPGWSSGRWWSGNEEKDICKGGSMSPVDGVDALCLIHDRAYCSADEVAHHNADMEFLGKLKEESLRVRTQLKNAPECDAILSPDAAHRIYGSKDRPSKELINKCTQLKSQENYISAAIPAFSLKIANFKRKAINKATKNVVKNSVRKAVKRN